MNAGQLAADEQANTSVKADMIFGGDVEQWMKFANTLYLRVLLRDFDTNRSKIQSLLAENNLLDTQDAAFDNFSNEADKSNPLYESDRRQLNTDQNIRCCSDILGVLSATDSRLSYYYEGGATASPTERPRRLPKRTGCNSAPPIRSISPRSTRLVSSRPKRTPA